MGRKPIYKETIRKNTVEDMKKMGNYRKEYDPVIEVYSELKEQYNILTQRFKDSAFKDFEVMTADGGSKKSPLIGALESLRKDILQYSNALMLNPKVQTDNIPTEQKKKKRMKTNTGNDALSMLMNEIKNG